MKLAFGVTNELLSAFWKKQNTEQNSSKSRLENSTVIQKFQDNYEKFFQFLRIQQNKNHKIRSSVLREIIKLTDYVRSENGINYLQSMLSRKQP